MESLNRKDFLLWGLIRQESFAITARIPNLVASLRNFVNFGSFWPFTFLFFVLFFYMYNIAKDLIILLDRIILFKKVNNETFLFSIHRFIDHIKQVINKSKKRTSFCYIQINNSTSSKKVKHMKKSYMKLQQGRDGTLVKNESQSLSENDTYQQWTEIKTSSSILCKRAHHASVILNNKMYIYGGYESGGQGVLGDFMCFNLQTNEWKPVLQKKSIIVGNRHSHSLVAWENRLILFGGLVNTFKSSNKVFSFELNVEKGSNDWREQVCTGEIPPGINSHRAAVIADSMFVFGGQQHDKYNQFMYQLNLITFQWKNLCKFTTHGISPRADFSMTPYNNKLYIFGGKKEDVKYNQLWQYDVEKREFMRLKVEEGQFEPVARSGHCACVYEGRLIVFGGTTGVTHERNDLVVYDVEMNLWQSHWSDEQTSLLAEQQYEDQPQPQHQPQIRFRNTTQQKKHPTQNDSQSLYQQINHISQSNTSKSPRQKYRLPFRSDNYYNSNYPFYGEKQGMLGNKHKKNDLLVDLEKEAKEEMRQNRIKSTYDVNNGQQQTQQQPGQQQQNTALLNVESRGNKSMSKMSTLHMSQTFESVNNSMFATNHHIQKQASSSNLHNKSIYINADNQIPPKSAQKPISIKNFLKKQPKSRDGHSCDIYKNKMVVFGGDRHHMSFNDVVIIDIDILLGRV